MKKFLLGETFTIITVVMGIILIAYNVYRLFDDIRNGDQLLVFRSAALILFFTILTVNRYIDLRRMQNPKKHTNDSEPMI